METKIAIFKGKQVRKIIHNNEWWFSIIDVIEVLTGSGRSRKYWNDLKKKLSDEGYIELSENIGQLKLKSSDGKHYETDCANTETMFRIVQSIPSPKAEPFKRWLARIGYERVQEIEDPELATKRTRALYKAKGYSDNWVEKRMRGIAIREELTDEWQQRGAEEERDYAILTAEISKATFGMTQLSLLIDSQRLDMSLDNWVPSKKYNAGHHLNTSNSKGSIDKTSVTT